MTTKINFDQLEIDNLKSGLQTSSTLKSLTVLDNVRINCLTNSTDDPGNTKLLIAFVPFNPDAIEDSEPVHYEDSTLQQIKTELSNHFCSAGDYAEEILITTQNSEYLIIYNANK